MAGETASKLKHGAKTHFINNLQVLLEMWTELFPNNKIANDLMLKFNGVVIGNDHRECEAIKSWHTNMSKDMHPKSAKYYKALERINGSPPKCYVACEYKDVDALFKSTSIDGFESIQSDYHAMTSEQKDTFWKLVRAMNRSALDFHGDEMQDIPNRNQIEANIAQHRLAKKTHQGVPSGEKTVESAAKSMTSAFVLEIKAFAKTLNLTSGMRFVDDLESKQHENDALSVMENWKKLMDYDIIDMCDERSAQKLGRLPWDLVFPKETAAEIAEAITSAAEDDAKVSEIVNSLSKINSLCSVQKHVPPTLMSKIELCAQKLASDIVSGTTDMSSLDLQEIGDQMLSSCTSEEMSAFAQNIDKLLPALKNSGFVLPK